jgi:hypothetical protein
VTELTDDVQTQGEGTGPMYHRLYAVDLPLAYDDAVKTMAQVMADPNAFSPQLIARFEKIKGQTGVLRENDEFMVHISAPWKAPVRVAQVTTNSFTLVTLNGHIEAGQIEFRLRHAPEGRVRFEIESLTRSKDQVVHFFYDTIRLAQFAQTEMWELFCKSFAETSLKAGGQTQIEVPGVIVKTRRQDRATGQWEDVSNQLGAKAIS